MVSNLFKHILHTKLFHKTLVRTIPKRQNSSKCPLNREDWPCRNQCRVGIVGLGGVGKSLAHLIKMYPDTITELRLLNRSDPAGIVEELSHLPTPLPITGVAGMENLCVGLRDLDIVVITAGGTRKKDAPRDHLFKDNATICASICKACAESCPTALIAIVTNPIDMLVPVAAEVLKKHCCYDPAKLFGLCKLDQLRARHYFAELVGIDPTTTYVPVVGGHAENTTVPLFSKCRPNIALTPEETTKLIEAVRTAGKRVVQMKKSSTTYSMASAAMHFIHKLSRAIRHEPNLIVSGYVESCGTTARFFSNELILGPGGVKTNLGFGDVNEVERNLIAKAVNVLTKQIKDAEEFASKLKI
ncbi:hypothetical protein KPH14_006950 [Odynerus spinipes]|uniref:Malate dehydrogenase, mitochondrial n=1 Tax=Odynerus spinipes TaxID=1348599 RepID=A0AAD9RRI3_9HYME|nr:hypothetical protein KPH14_006950 [Odynerus spinipes]